MKKTRIFASLLLIISLLLTPFTPVSAAEEAVSETTEVTRVEEIVSLRETNSETYLMSDGTYECVIFSEDKYYRDSNDALQLIDNSIVAVSEGAALMAVTQYQNAANAFDITLTGSGTPEVSITYLDAGITFSPLGAAREGTMHMTASDTVIAIGAVDNCAALEQLTSTGSNTATYANAFSATDLVYVVDNDALKEYIILKDASAPNQFSFLFALDGLTMQTVDGFTHFVNENEEIVFTLGSLFAVDANGKPTDALTYDFVPVKGNDDQVIVTVTLDNDYLTAADRAFPVVIDPTLITVSSTETADTCICSYFPSTNYYLATLLRTGYDSDFGVRRSYLKFNIPSHITKDNFLSATLDLEKASGVVPTVVAKRVTGNWTSSSLTWNSKPGETAEHESTQSVVFREGSAWYTMNVTSIVNGWLNNYYYNYGFVLIDTTENNENHWTTYYSSDAVSPHKPELCIQIEGTQTPSYRYVHFYDSSFPSSHRSLIPSVAAASASALQRQLGINLISNSTYALWSEITDECDRGNSLPCLTSMCGTTHHKDLNHIHKKLSDKASTVYDRVIFWTDREHGVYCNHYSGECAPAADMVAGNHNTYNRTIGIYNIPASAENTTLYEAYMGIALMHETTHAPPLFTDDSAIAFSSHDPFGYQCIMEYGAENPETFYSQIVMGLRNPLCSSCVEFFDLS